MSFFIPKFSDISSQKVFMLGTLLLSLTAIGVLFLGYQNLENVIQWEVLSELGEFPFVLESTASQKLLAKGYFVTEQFVASPMKINHLAAYFYIFLWCVSWSMVFAAITYWSRWAYLGAMAVTLAVLISLQLDFFLHQLGHIYTGVGLFLYLGISYSFHLFGSRFSFVQIFLSFLFFLLFIYLGVGWMSQQAFNALAVHWAGYSVGISLVVCLVFSFWVSYDIILWILRASLHNLGHFTFFSLVLLGNILLVFLKDMNLIDWPILYLNPFLLLTVSGILNLDNWRRLGNAFPAAIRNEFSYFIILGLFLLSMATIGWGYASANDPLLEALEDGVMYTHLIMGICFFLYIIVNFLPLLQHQKEVFRVIYKPLKMPLGVFRVLSLLIMMSILVLRNFFPLYQGLAGYTAGLADVAAFRDDFVFAQSQYQQALLYEGRHHKANYAMASLALWQGDQATAGVYFNRALQKVPSAYAVVGLSQSYQAEGEFFRAMGALQDGLRMFPNSGEIQHNLGYYHARTQQIDSAIYYYERAFSLTSKPAVPTANLQAIRLKWPDKSLTINEEEANSMACRANKLALVLRQQQALEKLDSDPTIGTDSVLSVADFAYLNNQILWKKNTAPDWRTDLTRWLQKDENLAFGAEISGLWAAQEYWLGDKLLALQWLHDRLGQDTTARGRYADQSYDFWLAQSQQLQAPRAEGNPESVQKFPFDKANLARYLAQQNRQKKGIEGYRRLLAVRALAPNDPDWQVLFVQQCLQLSLLVEAKQAMTRLAQISPTAYQRFLPTYQAGLALIEKERASF